jgi:hypothetical protein
MKRKLEILTDHQLPVIKSIRKASKARRRPCKRVAEGLEMCPRRIAKLVKCAVPLQKEEWRSQLEEEEADTFVERGFEINAACCARAAGELRRNEAKPKTPKKWNPDLSPIESVWADLHRLVGEERPLTFEDLKTCAQRA